MSVQTTAPAAQYRPTLAQAKDAARRAIVLNRPVAAIFKIVLDEHASAQRAIDAAQARLAATRPARRIAYDGGSRGGAPGTGLSRRSKAA